MNKRGFELSYIHIFYLLLAMVVVLTLLSLAQKVQDDTLFMQKTISIESSLLLSSVSFSPNDVVIDKTFERENLKINFISNPCLVEVYEGGEITKSKEACFSILSFENKELESPFIRIEKMGNKIYLSSPWKGESGGESGGAGAGGSW